MADLQLDDEIETGWARDSETIPFALRTALSLNIFGSKMVDRIFSVLTRGVKTVRDALIGRALWTDVDEFFWPEESGQERPPTWGTRNGFVGFVFRKFIPFTEVLYFTARNKYSDGAVQLLVSAETQNTGGVMFSVGVANDIDGPFTVYSPEAPLSFDPTAPQPMTITIPCGTLTVGKTYYYRIIRECDHQGDTLDADVIVTGVKVR